METNNNNDNDDDDKAEELETASTTFDMGSLSAHLPQKRKGLSKYFSGKSRSFACLNDAKSVNDLEKAEIPEAKRRKYLVDRQTMALHPVASCRNGSSSSSYSRSRVGV